MVSNDELTDWRALKAHSAMFVLARTIAPASRIRRTMNASSGGMLLASAIEPAVVIMSCVSKLSLTSMGTQNSGPGSAPAASAASSSSARSSAAGLTTVIALIWSAILVLMQHLVQKREEMALNQAGHYCLTNLINRIYIEPVAGGR